MKNYYISKSSRLQVFDKKVCVKNFIKFTGKHLFQGGGVSKVEAILPADLSKEGFCTGFSSEFCAILNKLQNCILRTIYVWWLFCSVPVKASLHFRLIYTHTNTYVSSNTWNEKRSVLKCFRLLVLIMWYINLLKSHCNTMSNELYSV